MSNNSLKYASKRYGSWWDSVRKDLDCLERMHRIGINTEGKSRGQPANPHSPKHGYHYILVLKFKDFSRTLKLHFQGPILNGSLQHGQ